MRSILVGPRLALSWLTVLPVHGPREVDRSSAGKAIASAPLVGIALGLFAAAVLWCASAASLAGILAGFLTVSALALVTRGMHVDGLADTVDGLGCYGPPERAREVMRSGSAGPFGVAAIVAVFAIQATGFGALADRHSWWSIVIAVAVGRVAVVLACRRGIDSATDRGFGALVAGTQPLWFVVSASAAAVLAAVWCVHSRPWQGPLAVAVALLASTLLVHHTVRRFGGMSGDVLGSVVEVTTTVTVVGLLVGS
ncbi:adenosylcobinamide-GDP ribazoletransferase [Rhodococcoides yunnanense]|uniref:adenosylcobinamide-GDP ribazoletransferase n=1 Tax=Rhodococcoides yunnanense TaxID=278209 RepID=UPI000932320C|nr:adenosylcobinamide-GDP ribazoletransferase [Rhodococcus yunnanensis]